MHSLATLIDTHGVTVDEHLDRDALVSVHTTLQFQGDVAVIPAAAATTTHAEPVPVVGVPVVRGESGGNTHLLLAAGPGVAWAPSTGGASGLDIGTLVVPDESTAYLAHPEHGYLGIGPGVYTVRRQREQADEIRIVAD